MLGTLRRYINLVLLIVIFGTPVSIALAYNSGTTEAQLDLEAVQRQIEANQTTVPEVTTTTTTVPPSTTVPTPSTLPIVQPTTTTTTLALPDGRCSEWFPLAVEVGWPIDRLEKLGRIMWAESNCLDDVANKTYSYGLLQMEWSAHKGWMASEFGVTSREELFDPRTNLTVGLWLAEYAAEHYGCWSQPWYMSGDWC